MTKSAADGPYDAYVICTAPRSGSTLLCGLLAAIGVAGNPGSYFHEPSLDHWRACHGLSPGATRGEIFAAAAAKARRGGITGFRIQSKSFSFFASEIARLHPKPGGAAARIEAVFGV